MTRTIRGAWSRRGTLLPLFLLTAVVVAGVVALVAVAAATGTSPAVAVPLLVLGLVAVPETGLQLAAARRPEIALARLRGLTGASLHVVLAAEPLLALLAGSALGLVLGAGVAVAAGAGPLTAAMVQAALRWTAGVVAVALVAVVAGAARALREPLESQVRPEQRPGRAGVLALFGQVLLLAGAAVALYGGAGPAASPDSTAGGPDWLVLGGPALVGLACGQLAVWLVHLAAGVGVAGSGHRGLAGFLAARRLARVPDAATALRLVVAAGVVAAVALTGGARVAEWTEDTTRLRAAAPLAVPFDGDVSDALALTRDLDPDGQHLMAAALVAGEGSVPARRAFLDTARYDAVAGDFLAGTPASGLADRLGDLRAGSLEVSGRRLEMTVRGVSRRDAGRLRPRVVVRYRDAALRKGSVLATVALDLTGRPATARATVPACDLGCTVTGLRLERSLDDAPLPFVVTSLDFGGTDLLASDWTPEAAGADGAPAGPVRVADGLLAVAGQWRQAALPGDPGGAAVPVLATASATWADDPVLDSPGGEDLPARVLDRLPALPLVGADGVLADLPRAAAGAPPTVPVAEVMVLAAADTPGALLDRLADATGSEPRDLATVRADVRREVGAAAARSYVLVAGFCLAVALLAAAGAVARQKAAHRREVAVLRLLLVPPRLVRRAVRVELAVLVVVSLAAVGLGGLVAAAVLLPDLLAARALVTGLPHTPPLGTAPSAAPLLLVAGVAAAVVAVVAGFARRSDPDATRPATLREEGA
ncbi:hypothetical protein ACFP3Q_17175 [Nocardioides sp. GCM10027113]|uniref:hypothetical protein n=1 Tax=unclassified Nocardioides TaxID=2615069 RepID=UPI0036155101